MDLIERKNEIEKKFQELEKARQKKVNEINEIVQEKMRLQGESRLAEELIKETQEGKDGSVDNIKPD